MIECSNLSLIYDDEKALSDVNLKIEKGRMVCVLGASGSGKTSLLSLLSGIRKPSAGTIKINSQKLEEPRLKTSYILQDFGLLPWKRVYDNITFSFNCHGINPKTSKVDEFAELLGIKSYYERFPHQLSGGQKQRVAITRALCLESDLILMDEAFSALDSMTKESLQDLLFKIQKEQEQTVVFVTHNIEEAVFLGSEIIIFKNGSIIAQLKNNTCGLRDSEDYFHFCQKVRGYLHD